MTISRKLAGLIGEWEGTNVLHAPWMPEPMQKSDSIATVRSKMNGQFLSIEYSWAFEGEQQEGMLILGCDANCEQVQAVWTDSWHSKDTLMVCNGRFTEPSTISMMGHYAVPEHPDWGWRSEIISGTNGFRYLMHNVSPEGEEALAVEMDFGRD